MLIRPHGHSLHIKENCKKLSKNLEVVKASLLFGCFNLTEFTLFTIVGLFGQG